MTQRNYEDPFYKEFRRKVLYRDRFRCQYPDCKCGSKKRLHVHHIVPWSQAPSLRYEVTNGITLCKEHHEHITGYEHIWYSVFQRIVDEKSLKKKKKK